MRRRPAIIYCLLLLALATSRPARSDGQETSLPRASERAERVQEDLRQILASPEYRREKTGPSVIERLGKSIGEAVARFFRWLGRMFAPSGRATGGGGGYVLFLALLAGLLVALAFLAAYLLKHAGRRASVPRRTSPPASSLLAEEPQENMDPAGWLALARERASVGDYRSAYRAAFIAVLLHLDHAGAIRYERARTNGDYLSALRAHPPLLHLLKPLAGEFDARWYGHSSVTEADYRRCVQACDEIASLSPSA